MRRFNRNLSEVGAKSRKVVRPAGREIAGPPAAGIWQSVGRPALGRQFNDLGSCHLLFSQLGCFGNLSRCEVLTYCGFTFKIHSALSRVIPTRTQILTNFTNCLASSDCPSPASSLPRYISGSGQKSWVTPLRKNHRFLSRTPIDTYCLSPMKSTSITTGRN